MKLISRIVSPLESLSKQFGSERRLNASKLYDHTFGLTSDPLTLFACAFSALIQSVDHPGVPNAVLVNEDGDLAKKYGGQSIAEQNSVEVAWNLLMADKYSDLRASIFPTSSEQNHFRQIVIHSVMATDMLDPKLKAMRNQQWKQTFGGNQVQNRRTMSRDIDNRKATIVIEHLMQTSSIAHTMQHVSSKCHNQYRTNIICLVRSLLNTTSPLSYSGIYTVNGAKSYIVKYWSRFSLVVPNMILRSIGLNGKFNFLTLRSYHWREN